MMAELNDAPLTPDELDEVRDRAEKATGGPWEARDTNEFWWSDYLIEAKNGMRVAYIHMDANEYDAYFIAAARTDIPRLLATVDAYRAIVERIAAVPDYEYHEDCVFCHESPGYTDIVHAPDCPITAARALLREE